TTILSLLAGLDEPTEGIVSFDGLSTKDIDRDEYRMEHVSVIYQNYNLFAHLTVMENAAYTLYIHNVPKKEADAIAVSNLKKVGITEEQMMRFPKTLSGGEQQRIAIARALASGSEIILADEPTGNLDTKNTENVIKILHSLAKDDGRCVIVVTHDLDVAQEADVVLKMSDGKLVDQR
ncbi:MAG: ATP-binding cassette domain-containing protein, partial [Clostridia bacterium]|nr:ATP-binding cassette domain-containing protein [Clostridia bacterium]